MATNNELYVLWTSDNPVSAEKMVFMYCTNSLIHGWWDKVTLIIWGAPALLVCQNESIQRCIQDAQAAGVKLTACKACADQLGVSDQLQKLGIEVKYWGKPLTELLKNEETLVTL